MDYYVQIVHMATGDVEHEMGPMNERRADTVATGAGINLDHNNYYIRVTQRGTPGTGSPDEDPS